MKCASQCVFLVKVRDALFTSTSELMKGTLLGCSLLPSVAVSDYLKSFIIIFYIYFIYGVRV